MSTRTNTWSQSAPVDHSQIKNLPAAIRRAFIDVDDRLDDILAGFTSGGNTNGIRIGRLLVVGSHPTAPGTGTAASLDLYAMTTGSTIYIYVQDKDSNRTFLYGNKARLLNNTWFPVLDAGGSGPVNTFKVNTASAIEFETHIYAPDTSPTALKQYAPKGYVDPFFPVNLAAPTTGGAGTAGVTGTLPADNGGTGITYKLTRKVAYTGNGSDDRNIAHGMGGTPVMVIITCTSTGRAPIIWTTGLGTASLTFAGDRRTNSIQLVDGTNVQVGTEVEVNNSGDTYDMVCVAGL